MKVPAIQESFGRWLFTIPVRPLFIPIVIMFTLFGRMNVASTTFPGVTRSPLEWLATLPIRLLIGALVFPIIALFGEISTS